MPDGFHLVAFRHPLDSGRKVWLSRYLYSLLDPAPELLVWVTEWSVWPSSEHLPLFERFRQSIGERQPLIETPGHLVEPLEHNDGISVLALAFLFVWDCYVIAASGRDALFTSHDEVGWFGSRDEQVARRVRELFREASVESAA